MQDYSTPFLTNRQKSRKPKQGKFWCPVCDMYMVHPYSRCPICKKKNGRARDKR